MSRYDEHSIPPELREIAKRLEAERPQASELELDRMKLKAMSAVPRAARRTGPRIGHLVRSGRLATIVLAFVLMVGVGAVLAQSGGPRSGSSQQSASKKEYEGEDCGQNERGRKKSKGNDECEQCVKVGTRTFSFGNGGNDCKPQCDKAGSVKTFSHKNGNDCKPQCDKAGSDKTFSHKNGSNDGRSQHRCKPRS